MQALIGSKSKSSWAVELFFNISTICSSTVRFIVWITSTDAFTFFTLFKILSHFVRGHFLSMSLRLVKDRRDSLASSVKDKSTLPWTNSSQGEEVNNSFASARYLCKYNCKLRHLLCHVSHLELSSSMSRNSRIKIRCFAPHI